jgi:HPt (histidine-containing phosphotransfer) domain-containing protein
MHATGAQAQALEPVGKPGTGQAFDYAGGLKAMDQEILEIIGQAFLDRWAEDMVLLRTHLDKREALPVLHTAHALKGTTAMFGAAPASVMAARIESYAAAENAAAIAPLLDPFVQEAQKLLAAIGAVLNAKA